MSLVLSSAQLAASTITLEITNIDKQKGYVRAALYDESNFLNEDVYIRGDSISVDGSSLTITFSEVPTGTYAVALYHDRNNNSKLDKNFVGMPKEPVAFSKGAKIKMGPPSFKSAAFEHLDEDTILTISF